MKKIVSLVLLVFLIVGCGAKSEEEKLFEIIGIEVDVDSAKTKEDGIYTKKTFNTNGCEYSIIYSEETIVGFESKESNKCKEDATTLLKNEMFLSENGIKEFEKTNGENGIYLIDTYTIKVKDNEFLFLKEGTPKTTSEVIRRMKELGLPIVDVVKYNEDTDENDLLGRPNQYIEKINFNDNNAIKNKLKKDIYASKEMEKLYRDELLNAIELFNNEEDMNKRYEYINGLVETQSGILNPNQYLYKQGNFLLRITYDLNTKDAKKYEETFNKLFEE